MKISKSHLLDGKTISITGSKSISNRLLILGKLFGDLKIENLSNSQDTQLVQKALNEDSETVDIHHAGTAMRFLTSFYAIQEGRKTILTGSERMKTSLILTRMPECLSAQQDIWQSVKRFKAKRMEHGIKPQPIILM